MSKVTASRKRTTKIREARATYQAGADVVTPSLPEVMSMAQRLPLSDQVELAEVLLRSLHATLRSSHSETSETELQPLSGMSEAELHVLADAVLAPNHQRELNDLLRRNRERELTEVEERRLDALLAEADQIALLKARALYTLNLRQRATGETPE